MKDETWEYDMWWDAVNGMEEDYDDMDDWQRPKGRTIIFPKLKRKRELRSFFVRLTYENSGLNFQNSIENFQNIMYNLSIKTKEDTQNEDYH